MPSTVIRRFAWRPPAPPRPPALDVEFVNGRVYRYAGVPEELAREMRSAFAKGVFFNRAIRPRYRGERLLGGWPDEGEAASV
jgi:hypothetical protein